MYYRRLTTKEELKEMSNYELMKMRRQLMSSIRKADEDRIKAQHLVEINKSPLNPFLDLWIEDEELIFSDNLTELIAVLEEIKDREENNKWAWEE